MEMNRPIRIFVVEDESLILKNIIKKIEQLSPDFQVVGSAYNGMDALALLESSKAQILFTDIKMPMMDGLDLIRRIREKNKDLQIAILSGYNDFEYARSAIQYGVADYLLKPVKLEHLECVLKKMQESIRKKQQTLQRSILTSAIVGNASGHTDSTLMPFSLSDMDFMLFLICFGNLKSQVPGVSSLDYATPLPSEGDLQQALNTCFAAKEDWWLIDERELSQKFLIVTAKRKDEKEILRYALSLQRNLTPIYAPITIAVCEHYIAYQDIEHSSCRLRSRLYHGLILGVSQILDAQSVASHMGLDISETNKLTASAKSANFSTFSQLLNAAFYQWQNSPCPQYLIEKMLLQILRLVENIFEIPEEENYLHERTLFECIQNADSNESLAPGILSLFKKIFRSQSLRSTDTTAVLMEMERILKKNYASPLNIEDLARK